MNEKYSKEEIDILKAMGYRDVNKKKYRRNFLRYFFICYHQSWRTVDFAQDGTLLLAFTS